MHSYKDTLPSTLWAWLGFAFCALNMIWTCCLLQAFLFTPAFGNIVAGMIMTVSTSTLIGIVIGIAIVAGVEPYDEERQCLLSRA